VAKVPLPYATAAQFSAVEKSGAMVVAVLMGGDVSVGLWVGHNVGGDGLALQARQFARSKQQTCLAGDDVPERFPQKESVVGRESLAVDCDADPAGTLLRVDPAHAVMLLMSKWPE
jgi:hypothetical protein